MTITKNAGLGLRLATLALSGLSMSACATVTRGTSETFEIQSTPPGAAVQTSNGFSCLATPCSFKMPRKPGFTATLTLPGYVTQTVSVESRMSGGGGAALAGNVLVGGLIGAGVDASSGALNDLTPNPLAVTLLTPAEQAAAEAAASQTTPK